MKKNLDIVNPQFNQSPSTSLNPFRGTGPSFGKSSLSRLKRARLVWANQRGKIKTEERKNYDWSDFPFSKWRSNGHSNINILNGCRKYELRIRLNFTIPVFSLVINLIFFPKIEPLNWRVRFKKGTSNFD